jgi:putative ABC transport system ATP-binding protein
LVDRNLQSDSHAAGSPKSMEESALPEIAILARGIKKQFGDGINREWVLKGIDLEVPRGDIQLLMGPSGSGKTTLLSILSGILTPTAGTVSLLGREITRLASSQVAEFRLQNIGFIFQEANLFPALTAVENVELAFQLKGYSRRAAHAKALELLAQCHLSHRVNYLPHDLSGGQKLLRSRVPLRAVPRLLWRMNLQPP